VSAMKTQPDAASSMYDKEVVGRQILENATVYSDRQYIRCE